MGSNSLMDPEMNAFRDFINAVTPQPNPNRTLGNGLPLTFAGGFPTDGRTFFDNIPSASGQCTKCHGNIGGDTLGSDNKIRLAADIQTLQPFKDPHLRNLYQKVSFNNTSGSDSISGFGFMHDGEQTSLISFL